METVTVGIHEAEEATAAALGELGWSIQDAKIQAEIMLYAELRGSNQGMYYSYDLEGGQWTPPSPPSYAGGVAALACVWLS